MMLITIVYNKKDKKLIPFQFGRFGEVILLDINPDLNLDDCIVSNVDVTKIDFINNILLCEEMENG